MDIVLGFLSSGGGKAEKSLGDYVDKVLKMKERPFSQKVQIPSYIGPSLAVTLKRPRASQVVPEPHISMLTCISCLSMYYTMSNMH